MQTATAQHDQQLAATHRVLSAVVRRMGGNVEISADDFTAVVGGQLTMAHEDGDVLRVTFRDGDAKPEQPADPPRLFLFGKAPDAPPEAEPERSGVLQFLTGIDPDLPAIEAARALLGQARDPMRLWNALADIVRDMDRVISLLQALRLEFAAHERARNRMHAAMFEVARHLAEKATEAVANSEKPLTPSEVAQRSYLSGQYMGYASSAAMVIERLQDVDAAAGEKSDG